MIPPTVHVVATTTHGRTLFRSPTGAAPFRLLAGFHGYGQNAEIMLAELDALPGAERWARASIQALHRFYNTRNHTVVASWMTREDRDHAIADNVAYVVKTLDALGVANASGPTVMVGFSQGVAMAYRAAVALGGGCQGVVALGGDVPPDVRERHAGLPAVMHLRGARDTLYLRSTFETDADWLTTHSSRAIVGEVDAGHEFTDEIRRRIGDFLAGL